MCTRTLMVVEWTDKCSVLVSGSNQRTSDLLYYVNDILSICVYCIDPLFLASYGVHVFSWTGAPY